MHAKVRRAGFATLMVFLALSTLGCGPKAIRSTGGGTYHGVNDGNVTMSREVKYVVDGNADFMSRNEVTQVNFAGGKVIVERTRILLNDKEVAKIPEATKKVFIDYTDGLLTVTADGTKVHEAKLAN